MSKSNKSARKDLESIYGKKDMFTEARIEEQIDELNKTRKRKIKTYREYTKECRYTNSKRKSLEKMLSFHHLKHKSNGGKAEAENGALLSALPHSYLHSLPRDDEEIINNMLREYKANFDVNCVSLKITSKSIEIEPLQQDEELIELPEEIQRGYIELEPMTPEEQQKYEEYKRQRNEKVKKKLGYNEALDIHKQRPKAHIDEEWQKEILEDLEMEFNERNRGGYGK